MPKGNLYYIQKQLTNINSNILLKEFSTIIQRCWTLDPNMRPTSAEVVESLRELGKIFLK